MMFKTTTFLTLLAVCSALPVEDGSFQNQPAQDLTVQAVPPFNDHQQFPVFPQGAEPIPADGPVVPPPAEGKSDKDLKTDPTFWFGYNYPVRRSYSYYRPRYYSYYVPRTYYWGPQYYG